MERDGSSEERMSTGRQSFGIEELDRSLGGGLLPGTLTVVAGATGAGKTQLGLRWADAGLRAEGHRGVLCDLTSRGDSQNHAPYASRLFGWSLARLPGYARARSRACVGLHATARRLLSSDGSGRAAGDPGRPG